ncbi:hypothetical protein TWF718_002050 [Orbilia javanica]|uniref:tyrosinase n=1 Tax=Orbilia javanica TaxID=47235 RepID=A0AAN8MW30_9PEZI
MKVSVLLSALATTTQLVSAAPFAAPEPDNFGDVHVHGVAHLYDKLIKKRALLPDATLKGTTDGRLGGIQSGNNGNQMVERREIRKLYTYTVSGDSQPGRVYDLFIIALRRTQVARSYTDKNSWWQLAGIHGRPFISWNGRAPGAPSSALKSEFTGTGYCTHGSTLFPTWHRPYLAYVEEVLWMSAYWEIQSKVKDAKEKAQWEKALEQLRLPYWDWATNGGSFPDQIAGNTHTFRFYPGESNKNLWPKWENPLYTFRFQSGTYNAGTNFGNDAFRQLPRTLRHPKDQTPGVGDNIGEARSDLRNNAASIQQQVNEVLLRSLKMNSDSSIRSEERHKINTSQDPARWGAFSNRVGNSGSSVESIHDTIHVLIGGRFGHMTSVPYSSFDPVFFLHHCNVDRLFAIWQAINPDSYVTWQQNGGGTYGIAPGTNDTVNSPLEPWLNPTGGRLNSNAVKNTATFGYGYPEVPKHLYQSNPVGLRRFAMTEVQKLYPNTVSSSSKRKRDLYTSEENEGLDNSVDNNQYYEWRVDVATDRGALNGSYSVHFFLGKPARDYKQWASQPEFVGDYIVFTHSMEPTVDGNPEVVSTEITGSVPLTNAMVKAFARTNLTSLNPQDAIPFLIRNLRWRVTDSLGNPVRPRNVKGLKVSVSISHCTLPTDQIPWTQYGEWTFLTEIARRIGKDGGPDKVGIPDVSSSSTTAAPTSTTEAPAYGTELSTLVTSATEEPTSEAATTEAPTSTEDAEAPTTTADAVESTVEASSTASDDASPTDG